MTDILDHAQHREESDRERGIERVRRAASLLAACHGSSLDPTPAARLCETCADPIDPERLQALPGADRCVFCQERWETHWKFLKGGR